MRRAIKAAAVVMLAAALAGCTEARDNGDGTVTVPWWVLWQNHSTHTETRYVPAPGPAVRPPAYRAPAPVYRAPAPAYRAPTRMK